MRQERQAEVSSSTGRNRALQQLCQQSLPVGCRPAARAEQQNAGGFQFQEVIVGRARRGEDQQSQDGGGEEIPVPQLPVDRWHSRTSDGRSQQGQEDGKAQALAQGVARTSGAWRTVLASVPAAAAQLPEVFQEASLAQPLKSAPATERPAADTGRQQRDRLPAIATQQPEERGRGSGQGARTWSGPPG